MNIFYTPEIEGDVYQLSEEESKHCIRVLRHRLHDELILVDGLGGWYRSEIIDDHPKKSKVKVIESKKEFGKKPYYLHIAIAPTKNIDRFEWFLEKACEIGVNEITPLLCEHSVRNKIKADRLEKVLVAAMKQSLKAYLPILNNLTNFESFVREEQAGRKMIAHCVDNEKAYLFNAITKRETSTVLIGPEGDFSDDEINKAFEAGFQPVSLGSSRLRTETAGIAVAQIVNVKNEEGV